MQYDDLTANTFIDDYSLASLTSLITITFFVNRRIWTKVCTMRFP